MSRFLPLLLSAIFLFAGCTDSDSKSIALHLTDEGSGYEVDSYKVTNNAYKKSSQQGIYRIHLLDEKGNILAEVGFDKLKGTSTNTGSGDRDMDLVIPVKQDMHRVVLFKMDGSSGHYQLDSSDPLLIWTLPDSVKNSVTGDRK